MHTYYHVYCLCLPNFLNLGMSEAKTRLFMEYNYFKPSYYGHYTRSLTKTISLLTVPIHPRLTLVLRKLNYQGILVRAAENLLYQL